MSPAVSARPVAWANSFSTAGLGKRGSIRPSAYTYADVVTLLLSELTCIETPQVGHGKGAGDLGAGLAGEATGIGASFPLADTVVRRSFDSGSSIRLAFLEVGCFSCLLARETHPAVERSRAFFAARTRFDSHRVRDAFDDITEAYLLFFDETGKANAMGLVFTFSC